MRAGDARPDCDGDRMRPQYRYWLALAAFVGTVPVAAQQVEPLSGSVVKAVADLRPGEFVWAPEIAPSGPMMLIVNVSKQRAVVFRNGVPIGASTVSTGRPGHSTPTGVFTILQKHVEHYSSIYDNAPMPYMQRLTWGGVALHAGKLPGYPASHGCIRLPAGFAKLLYGATKIGMTVVITDQQTTPRVAPAPSIVSPAARPINPRAIYEWTPGKSPQGPVSILVSAADKRAIVLRNGVEIGSAPVTIEGPVTGTWAYALRSVDAQGPHWIRMVLSQNGQKEEVPHTEWSRFHAPDGFRQAVAGVITPGTTIVVTADSLSGDGTAPLTVIEGPGQ